MENKRILTVNPVPAKTWYWLKMNDRKVKVSTDSVEITPPSLPHQTIFPVSIPMLFLNLSEAQALKQTRLYPKT
ncbi:MAG: hypothetical protein IKG91_04415 [Firmicutes bacterium]|nr:hypothetical protein [Bacillota bacterium]